MWQHRRDEARGGRRAAHVSKPSPALSPPPGHPRFALMDGLRAIAVVAILAFHVAGTSADVQAQWWGRYALRLDVGVTIFFVISGFLLYRPFVAARFGGAAAPRFGAYARRRALRILPAYWLALSALAVYPGLPGFGEHWWAFYGFLQVYDSSLFAFYQGLPQAWSLCVEVTFYALLPLIALGVGRMHPEPSSSPAATLRRELVLLAGAAVAAVGLRLILGGVAPRSAGPQTLPVLFHWFAGGMALAVLSAWADGGGGAPGRLPAWVGGHPNACWAGAGAVFLLCAQIGAPVTTAVAEATPRSVAVNVLYAFIAVLAVAPAVFASGRSTPVGRILTNPVVAWLGLISYGIFLWQVTVLAELSRASFLEGLPGGTFAPTFIAGLAITCTLAALSYYLVERPLLQRKDRAGGSVRSSAG